jgi:hypothetical protein
MATWLKREMTETQRKSWEKTRQRGEVWYVLIAAFIGGATICASRLIFDAQIRKLPTDQIVWHLLEPVLSGAFAGFVTGVWDWHSNERRYQRTKDQQNSTFAVSPVGSDDSQRGMLNGRSY